MIGFLVNSVRFLSIVLFRLVVLKRGTDPAGALDVVDGEVNGTP